MITETFHCEIKTLGYPRAALFSFCMVAALRPGFLKSRDQAQRVAYNVLSCVKAALRSVHGTGKIEAGLSNYYLADEVAGTYRGMMIAIPPEHWQVFEQMTVEQFCAELQYLATKVRLEAFSSTPAETKEEKAKTPLRSQASSCFYCPPSGTGEKERLTLDSGSLLSQFYLIDCSLLRYPSIIASHYEG